MKKENKRIAQEKRAQQRAQAAKRARMTDALKIWVPICGGLLILAIMVFAIATSGSSSDTGDASAGNVSDDYTDDDASADLDDSDESDEPALNTTEGIVVQDGDYINLDYVGYLDGVPFDGGSTNGMGTTLLIGSGSYIEGFEEGIIGHAIGETFDLNLSFPEDYWNEEMAGKEVVFTTTVNGIYE